MMTIGVNTESSHGRKKKTSAQLQLLEKLYSEEKYPTPSDLEDYATLLNLTYKQTRTWFIEKRRKEKRDNEVHDSRRSFLGGKNKFGSMKGGKGPMVNAGLTKSKPDILSSSKHNRNRESNQLMESVLGSSNGSYKSTYKRLPPKKKFKTCRISEIETRFNDSTVCPDQCNEKSDRLRKTRLSKTNHNGKKIYHPQVLVSKDYILKRVFRKDGPPLGEEFDSLPGTSSGFEKDSRVLHSSQDRPKASRNKRSCPTMNSKSCQPGNATAEKHGIGKGLMTIWRARNPDKVKCPSNIVFAGQFRSSPKKTPGRASKIAPQKKLVPKKQIVQRKFQQKRSSVVRRGKVPVNKESNKATSHWQCNLLHEESDTEQFDALAQLVDDEELELREIQVGPNPLRCSHFALDGKHGCPLCKDMLARFPPPMVKMKQLFCIKPWDTSPVLVKKLLKVLKLLYNDAATIELCPFTITELANAFTDKDSMLLGNIHVFLLKFLLLNVEKDVLTGYIPRATKDGRFLGFLNFVKEQEIDVNAWCQALNPLTWIEILRQVLVAAGFGTKSSTARRDDFSKERHLMVKYGIRPRTLKGELFNILSEHGSSGVVVTELAKASQIAALDLADTIEEVQKLIYSTLSSDITLFEKISSSTYRLRINPEIKGNEDNQSDSEVDDEFESCSGSNTNYDSDFPEELNSDKSNQKVVRYKHRHKRKNQKKTIEYTEIDESYLGEAWLLGLMEGEYSDLSIDEKLDALIALADLTASCCSFRTEELEKQIPATAPTARFHGSGAKIKKSLMDHILMLQNPETVSGLPNKKQSVTTKNTTATDKSEPQTHSMQSIYLGSDRRYNDYWLFIGPCDITDPGHRQVYFESSEDGHWEIINSSQALDALLSALDSRGSREARLLASLEKKAAFLSRAMDNYMTTENNNITSDVDNISGDGSSPISDVDNNLDPPEPLENQIASSFVAREVGRNRRKIWDRMQEFDRWVWDAFYSNLNAVKSYKSKRSYMESLARCESCHDLYCRDERHCRTCHTTFQLDFDIEEKYAIHVATCTAVEDCFDVPKHKVLSSQLQALKAASHAIEAVMPETSLSAFWTKSAHKLWAKRLQRTSSLPEFLQVLTDFVGAINVSWLYEYSTASSSKTASDDIIVNFQIIPQTTSAIALWIVKLDALIAPHLEKAQPRQKAVVPCVEKSQPIQNAPRPKRKRICTS